MNINATVVVQALNFFIVYWMLRLFLFKPVIGIIQHEEAQEHAMLNIIDQQKKSLEIQEKERQRHWYICQEYYLHNQPDTTPAIHSLSDITENFTETVTPLSADDIADTIAKTRTSVEAKIKHVH